MDQAGRTIENLAKLLDNREGYLALSYLDGRSPGSLEVYKDQALPEDLVRAYLGVVRKRKAGLPLQYALGRWDFYGRTFLCDPRALIPRPETELLVDLALKKGIADSVADIGTGTGCIILTLALELGPGTEGKKNIFTGTDLSDEALDLARENETFLLERRKEDQEKGRPDSSEKRGQSKDPGGGKGSWFQGLHMVQWKSGRFLDPLETRQDWVVSNPPYLAEKDQGTFQEELAYEPAGALFAGEDGLDAYRALIAQLPDKLKQGGQVLLEIGDDQGGPVCDMLARAGLGQIEVYKDYAGLDRIVYGRWGDEDV